MIEESYLKKEDLIGKQWTFEIDRLPEGLAAKCYWEACGHIWRPVKKLPQICPKCKKWFWRGRYPTIVEWDGRDDQEKIIDAKAVEMVDGEGNIVGTMRCEGCGMPSPKLVEIQEKKLCAECVQKWFEKGELPQWVQDDMKKEKQKIRVDTEIPEFGEDIIVQSGVCGHCGGKIENDVAQEKEDGTLICANCIQYYATFGRLPKIEDV